MAFQNIYENVTTLSSTIICPINTNDSRVSFFFVFVFGMPSSPGQCLALNEAVKCNAATLVKSLIEADANPQLKDGHGETAIQCALAEMMPLLLGG